MPYIKLEDRHQYDKGLDGLITKLDSNGFNYGHINYIFSVILRAAWKRGRNYDRGNSLVGVLECAKQEFYRRVLAPYEHKKMNENGDVY